MKISIALCAYNGSAYLQEQLDSISAQTRPPDELIICDDGSSDATREILEAFAARAAFPTHLYFNEQHLGSTKNFEKAIGLCSGDILALADQDDVWQPEKLERIEQALQRAPQVGLVFTNAELVDEHLRPLGRRLFRSVDFTTKYQRLVRQGRAFEVLLKHNVVTGATMAFRAHLRKLILPIPTSFPLIHDGWIALVIAAVADLEFIEQPLISYRQHSQQQMGAKRLSFLETLVSAKKTCASAYLNYAEQFARAYERLSANREWCRKPVLPLLEAKLRHLRARAAMPKPRLRRVPVILKEVLNRRYSRYSSGLYSAAKDILF